MDKNNNPMSRLMELAAPYKSKYVLSVIMAVLGVAAGLLPFFAVSKIVVLLMNGETTVSVYMEWCLFAGLGFLAKVCFSNLSTLVSHTATFATLAEIRLRLVDKLTRVPMGYMINTPSGELKNVLVDRVEGMETTLAHLIPELTANLSRLYLDLSAVFGLEDGSGIIGYPANRYVVLQGNGKWI